MNVTFACPLCDHPSRVEVAKLPQWQCPACDHRLALDGDPCSPQLQSCPVCGTDVYRKKDFPHRLGMAILLGACVASAIAYALYEWWICWGILIGSALFDGLLYTWVGDVLVCYRCNAHILGFDAKTDHKGFDLGTAERYRQERMRRERLAAEKKGRV